jgi:PqqD family protein of HPr-rel-A system
MFATSVNRQTGWTVLSPGNILTRSWNDDGLVVVYSGLNGNTHLVSPLAGEMLRLLMTGSRTSETLLRDLADVFENHDEDRALDIIGTVLSELRNIHLISSESSQN